MYDANLWVKALPKLLEDSDFVDAFVKELKQSCAQGVPDLFDCACTAFDACSEEALQFCWDSGSSWLRVVGDICICISTDWATTGPYESIEEALATADTFLTETTDPSFLSRHISETELLRLARSICPQESRASINGDEYGWKGNKFVPADELEEEPEEPDS